MALSQRLTLTASQSLVMTPQLQQAIKLLQYSQAELAAFVEQEIERNPLLDLEQPPDDERAGERTAAAGGTVSKADAADEVARIWGTGDRRQGASARTWADRAATARTAPAGAGASDSVRPDMDRMGEVGDTAAGPVSLRDHLFEQINIDIADQADRLIARRLVDHLDAAGYLAADLAEIAADLGCGTQQVADILARLQTFDPPGIFGRSLQECLTLQLRDRGRLDATMRTLVEHLPLLADGRMDELMRHCGVDRDRLAAMIAELRSLDPKPALAFDHEIAQTVRPDLVLRRDADGGWRVELNPDLFPRPVINRDYYSKVIDQARRGADRSYIKDQFRTATWLVKALQQRAATILNVATEIVRVQSAFFDHGVRALEPLVLRDIARAIDMHESTVSRATANKFMATPRGTFELKFFFTSAVGGRGGQRRHSSAAVRHRIRSLIDAETAGEVLSDDRIVALLKADGVEIARRTVAKYRTAMRIPSSTQRRRRQRPSTPR